MSLSSSKFCLLTALLFFMTLATTSTANAKSRKQNLATNMLLKLLIEEAEEQSLNLVISPKTDLKQPVYIHEPLENLRDKKTLLKLNDILNTLESHALVNENTLKIIPLSALKKLPGTIYRQGSGMENTEWAYATLKVKRNVCVGQLVPMLRTLLPLHAHLAQSRQDNSLIIFDRKANIDKIQMLINAIEDHSDKNQAACEQH